MGSRHRSHNTRPGSASTSAGSPSLPRCRYYENFRAPFGFYFKVSNHYFDQISAVKKSLIAAVTSDGLQLPEGFTCTSGQDYARRLLHCTDRYAVVVMVWGPGQGTPIHDHDDKWCVECVYQGTIRVISYDLIGSPEDEVVSFHKEQEIAAGKGEAGALIPPFDYHLIENTQDDVAVTIHVYGGEMHGCEVFQPVEGDRYRREHRLLSYTS